ncbi:MAG: hypothetical protein B2I17_00620 [Thermoplasmatales archaeon B_DKE]|nr:MAG: hypothetical protein B2I17_00620 [Thermoplasmatales archaeon B_DKE]QRF75635.1 N-glycosylase/DNA lyase [Thermoplasmatales archaeon]
MIDSLKPATIAVRVAELVSSPVSEIIAGRAQEFRQAGKSSKEFIFGELCFCILTANTSADMGVSTQNLIGLEGFMEHDEGKLRDELKRVKYRFYNLRSKYIVEARWIIDKLPDLMENSDRHFVRDYLVDNVKGIGYKEASHFLRNVGIFDFAILDKHILRMLSAEYPGVRIKVSTRQSYLETERYVMDIARDMGMEPGILDLYMWKLATGKIIK